MARIIKKMKKIVVCGIGNRLRGDDAVGPLVIEELNKKGLPQKIFLLDCGPSPESFAGRIISFEPDIIIIVDAVQMNRMPGDVAAIPVEKIKPMLATTHKMPITLFIDYLQRSLPKAEIVFMGIQHSSTLFGAELSKECKYALKEAIAMIEKYFNNI